MRQGITTIAIWLISWTSTAQTAAEGRITYTRKEGLTNNNITALAKDSRGFLWLGTSEGLNRFDGAHFTAYFSDPHSPQTLAGNTIYDILQYQPGHLLIATDNGLSVLNTLTGEFENDKITVKGIRKGSGVYIRNLFQTSDGHILINHSGEIDIFDQGLHYLNSLTNNQWARSIKGIVIGFEHCYQDRQGRIWVPSDNLGLCIIDEKAQQVYNYANNPEHYPFLLQKPVRSFYYDDTHEQLYLSILGSGLQKYDLRTGAQSSQHFGMTSSNEGRTINSIIVRGDRLICGGGQGIYSVDPKTLQYTTLNTDDPSSRTGNFINCFTMLDDQHNTWIGTETKGLIQLRSPSADIRQIALPDARHNFPNPCSAIFRAANGLLYFAYDEYGLVEVDERTGHSKRYRIPSDPSMRNVIHTITADIDRNCLLIGTLNGFYSFDLTRKTSRRTGWMPSYTDKLSVSYTLRDKQGNIWTAFKFPNSIGYYEAATRQFHHYSNYRINQKPIFDSEYPITRMTEDEKGNIWMITFRTAGELLRYDRATRTWATLPNGPAAKAIFKDKELNCLLATDSVIWTGNIYGMGLIRYNFRTDSIRRIGRKDGLLSDNILSIGKDRNNNLVICTVAGINHYNTTTGEIRTLIAEEGDIDWGLVFSHYYDTIHNRLIYGLNDRIITVEGQLWETPARDTFHVYIDAVRINNKNNISINFTSINFDRAVAPSYAYKMVGTDKDWNMAGQANTVNYSNLSPGTYNFLVKAKSPIGTWGPVNDTVHIRIRPAIWQTAWFWVSVGLSITLVLWWLIRRRIAHIRHSAELKQQLAEMEMMALRTQMNPHFIFNCLSAIDNLMQTNQADKATTYLASFARLIRSVLENSKNNLVPFDKDIETLQLYLRLEQFRASNKFTYELNVDQELMNGDYKVPPLIVQPFIENAIQHGLLNKQQGERNLTITVSLKNGFIQYTIFDNGIGRLRATEIKSRNRPEHRSYGIQITTQRLHLHNHTNSKADDIIITDLTDNGEPNGTRIDVLVRTD